MEQSRTEAAVSEVMGEVLILALVVGLAAIIGGMVFGLFGNIQQPNLIGVTAIRGDSGSGNVTITYDSGSDQVPVYWLSISVNGTAPKTLGVNGGTTPLVVGNSTVVRAPVPGSDHVVVVGNFADGTQQVVLDTIV